MEPPENQKEFLELFKQGPDILENALAGLSDKELDHPPSNGGWTIRQIVHHLVDGDDIWKNAVKMALGNEDADFSLEWYLAFPQTEWAKKWNYENRSIDISLTLFRANRKHIQQLLEYAHNGWKKSIRYRDPKGEIEVVTIEDVIQMQAEHVIHHVKRISEILKEMSGT
jgi:uncharacterized damage-inducible protein DinB